MWHVTFEILSAKVEILTQFNVTKYEKTGGADDVCNWIINAETIVVMHSYPTAYVIKNCNRALIFFKNRYAMTKFESL